MTDIEKLNLPTPIKVKPSISKYLDDLEEQGKTIYAFAGADFVETLSFLYLLNKYKSKCFASSKRMTKTQRPLGLTINLKINYSKAEEHEYREQFEHMAKIIANCVKRGEETIIIPLTYIRGQGGHANMLILKMNIRELEHYEPHGGEYVGNEKLQLSSKKVLSFFVNILNKELKKDNLPEVKYTEASQVCPYISGFQELEGRSKLPKKGKLEPRGYCAAWSIFFAELSLKNPELSSSEILDYIYNYLTTKSSGPDYLKGVIRGYAGYIMEQIDVYLSIFFKPKIKAGQLLSRYVTPQSIKLKQVLDILVDIEVNDSMNPEFNLKKELKKAMKEYKELVKGKTNDEEKTLRNGPNANKEIQNAYFKKRILQNYDEYKRVGRISEPILDSAEDLSEELEEGKIVNPDILKKGLMHEKIKEEKQKQHEELMKIDWYKDLIEWKEQMKKERAQSRKQARATKGKTRKNRS